MASPSSLTDCRLWLGLVVVFNMAVTVPWSTSAALADACNSECIRDPVCFTSGETNCPFCDEVGSFGCESYVKWRFNPSGDVWYTIQGTGNRRATSVGEFICYTEQSCGDATTGPFAICAGSGAYCATIIPIPSFCVTCSPVGFVYNHIFDGFICSECS
jgi:hypothetical protein